MLDNIYIVTDVIWRESYYTNNHRKLKVRILETNYVNNSNNYKLWIIYNSSLVNLPNLSEFEFVLSFESDRDKRDLKRT